MTGLANAGEVLLVEIEPWAKDPKYVFVQATHRSFIDETRRPVLIEYAHHYFKDAAPMEWEIKPSRGIEQMAQMESQPEPKQNPRPSAVVYFIQAGEFVKIGFSVNPESRIDELKTGCPFELKLLTTVPGGKKMEKELHQIFAAHRQHGEWFTFHQDIKDYIAKYL